MTLEKNAKILVADDLETIRRMVKNALNNLGYRNLTLVENGSDAWKALNESVKSDEYFDFIISDWNMPNMTGLELLEKIRSTASISNLPFLMLSSEAEEKKVISAIQAGIDSYIVKPFTDKVLKEKIEKIFG